MGGYTVIADASNSILELLRKTLSPEPIKKAESIGLCQPNDRGSYTLGLYLYDVKEVAGSISLEKIKIDPEHYKDPPVAYELFYMAFVHSESEINTRLIDEQRILGRVLQKFCDYRRIPQEYLMGTLKENKEILDIQGLNLTIDEKIKIWSLFNEPYRTSFFYKAGPVFMESDLIKTTKRVISANISTRHK